MHTAIKTALACGVMLGMAAAADAQDFRWRGSVANGNTVEVKGVNGGVYAQASTDGQVEVIAQKTSRRSNPDDVRIEVFEHGDGVTICAVYPSRDGAEPNECRAGGGGRMSVQNNDVQVRFTVRIPPGVRFLGQTVNGEVEAVDMGAPVALSTVNGSVRFSTSETARAKTVNGSITGSLGRSDWPDTLEFATVNGAITLTLPADLNTDVNAETMSGDVSTDFPVSAIGRLSRRSVRGTIGAGGRMLSLKTVNGGISLRRF